MIATLGALLETVAVLAGASACASIAVRPALALLAGLRAAPATRADLALCIAAVPAGAVLAVAVAVALPGALDLAGLGADHCHEHGGHGHLCLAHPTVASPALVALGALALGAAALRAGRWASARAASARDLAALVRLGRPGPEGAIRLDGEAVLCHAAGALAPKVLVSARVLRALPDELLTAALEHERAHVRRRDVLARDLLSTLGLFAWPGVTGAAAAVWEAAAEEAADAEAADRVGGVALAGALVAVARLERVPAPAALPLVDDRLARRVAALLAAPPRRRPALALAIVPAAATALIAAAAANADALHHAAETALHLLLGG